MTAVTERLCMISMISLLERSRSWLSVLGGIPVAIGLGAARVSALPVPQIAGRLDDRFRVLTAGDRRALPHQQTLRALIEAKLDHSAQQQAEAVCLCMNGPRHPARQFGPTLFQ